MASQSPNASTDYNRLSHYGAVYDYDAFGREVRSAGPAADSVPFHFSSKFTDAETGLNYYGYRFYDPVAGRWLNRDPIGERGGSNIYVACLNNFITKTDFLGLSVKPGDLMTPLDFAKLSADDKEKWAKNFQGRFGGLIEKHAKEQCIPKRLLAAIIANELTDWDWADGTVFDGMGGGGVGPAQIAPSTAVSENVTGIDATQFKPYVQSSPAGPTSMNAGSIVSVDSQLRDATRQKLLKDGGAVEIAARLMRKLLDEMCAKAARGLPAGAARFFGDCDLERDFCCRKGDCDQIVNMSPSRCLVRAMAAYWNTNGRDGKPSVLDAKDPIEPNNPGGNFFNAARNGIHAKDLQPMLDALVP